MQKIKWRKVTMNVPGTEMKYFNYKSGYECKVNGYWFFTYKNLDNVWRLVLLPVYEDLGKYESKKAAGYAVYRTAYDYIRSEG